MMDSVTGMLTHWGLMTHWDCWTDLVRVTLKLMD